MTDYRAMYLALTRGILDAKDLLPMIPENNAAGFRLNQAMQEAEEIYMETADDEDEKDEKDED